MISLALYRPAPTSLPDRYVKAKPSQAKQMILKKLYRQPSLKGAMSHVSAVLGSEEKRERRVNVLHS